jgi:hypothetical protein
VALPTLSVPRLVAVVLLLLCFLAGYAFAQWWWESRDPRLATICARIDYINGLQQEFGQDIAEEVREQLEAGVEDCRAALRDRVGEAARAGEADTATVSAKR